MLASELVSIIQEEVGAAWSRPRILDVLNRAQNELLATNNEISRVQPDPFLTTEDGVYSYVATDCLFDSSAGTKGAAVGDVRYVDKIYSLLSTLDIFGFTGLDSGSAKPFRFERGAHRSRVISDVGRIQSKAADSSDCVLKWWEGNNPGDTTVTWRAEAYLWPTQLLVESVPMTVPDDFCDTLLVYSVVRRLERRETGRQDASYLLYKDELKRFKSKYSATPSQEGPVEARFRIC